jgi:ABC-type multidrug transport system fused ATPase/permease subunit
MAPMVVSNLVSSAVSLKRIETYLLQEELDPIAVIHGPNDVDIDANTAIQIKDGTFFWKDDEGDILKNINFKIKKGSLVAVSTYSLSLSLSLSPK